MVETILQNILYETIIYIYILVYSLMNMQIKKQASELSYSSAAMVGFIGIKYSLTLGQVFNSTKSQLGWGR